MRCCRVPLLRLGRASSYVGSFWKPMSAPTFCPRHPVQLWRWRWHAGSPVHQPLQTLREMNVERTHTLFEFPTMPSSSASDTSLSNIVAYTHIRTPIYTHIHTHRHTSTCVYQFLRFSHFEKAETQKKNDSEEAQQLSLKVSPAWNSHVHCSFCKGLLLSPVHALLIFYVPDNLRSVPCPVPVFQTLLFMIT